MTDTMTSQNIDLSFWDILDTLYLGSYLNRKIMLKTNQIVHWNAVKPQLIFEYVLSCVLSFSDRILLRFLVYTYPVVSFLFR
jgi:hypothetical protein